MDKEDKRMKAAALKYRPKIDSAPRVIAKGQGKVAEKIIEIAKAHHLHIQSDPDLIEVLSRLDINEEIPYPIDEAIASINLRSGRWYDQRVVNACNRLFESGYSIDTIDMHKLTWLSS